MIKNEDSSYSHKGTGFLISSDGLFISACHVFNGIENPCERFFCAFPSDNANLISIISLNFEYKNTEQQKGSVYKDLAIGKMDYNSDNYYILKRKRPLINTIQKITGYVFVGTENRFQMNANGTLNLIQIQPDTLETVIVNRFAVISNDLNDYQKEELSIENKKKYNNVLTLRNTAHHGSSGCPVINSNSQIIGMYFGGPSNHRICHILTSKYIGKRIKKLTNYKFDRYQDIKISAHNT
nr:trypsin-like peptidase domain-containing protein [Microbacter margulisiae]